MRNLVILFTALVMLAAAPLASATDDPLLIVTDEACRVEVFVYRLVTRADRYGVDFSTEPSPHLSSEKNTFAASYASIRTEYREDGKLTGINVTEPILSTLSSFSLVLSSLDKPRYVDMFNEETEQQEQQRIHAFLNYLIASGSYSTDRCDLIVTKTDTYYWLSIEFRYQ